jgi:hypothetical protein
MEGTLSNKRGLKRAITPKLLTMSVFCRSLFISFSVDSGRPLTSGLEGFNVLGALGELSDGLDEGNAGLLVGLEWGEDGS